MSSIQIPNLGAAIALSGAEQLEVVQSGTSVRTTTQAIANLVATLSSSPVYTVATLPLPAIAGNGARAFVTDATATTFASIVAGAGSTRVPVFCDGTNWRIG